jgi:DNA-binding transcriptional regulator YhcF (GntR family)
MDFKETKPIFLQVAERICDEILGERYKEDERVPSVREYSTLVEVNVNTAMRSYDYLQQQEIIYNKRGLGYFVSHGAKELIVSMRRKRFVDSDLPEFFRQMRMLGITIDDIVRHYREFER